MELLDAGDPVLVGESGELRPGKQINGRKERVFDWTEHMICQVYQGQVEDSEVIDSLGGSVNLYIYVVGW